MFWMIVGYAKSYLDKCARDNIGAYAAQTAYFLIMSAIPFVMLIAAMLNLIPQTKELFETVFFDMIPDQYENYIKLVLNSIMQNSIGAVSISSIMAFWAAGKAFQNLMVGLNVVNQADETRNWFKRRLLSVFYTILLLLAIIMILTLLVFVGRLQVLFAGRIGFLPYIVRIRPFFRWIFVYLILVVLFTVIFMTLPNKKLTFVSQLPGGVFGATSMYVFSIILAIWTRIVDTYSMYGTLATLMMMMFWLYFCMYFMLMCAEVNAFFDEALKGVMKKWLDGIFH